VLAQCQAFEKITIRPAHAADQRNMRLQVLPDGELIGHAVSVIDLIIYAYDVPANPSPRLNALPEWVYGDIGYDIQARAPRYAITPASSDEEIQLKVKQRSANCSPIVLDCGCDSSVNACQLTR
jgi:uncharacterized protein (TIGR03435 family)